MINPILLEKASLVSFVDTHVRLELIAAEESAELFVPFATFMAALAEAL